MYIFVLFLNVCSVLVFFHTVESQSHIWVLLYGVAMSIHLQCIWKNGKQEHDFHLSFWTWEILIGFLFKGNFLEVTPIPNLTNKQIKKQGSLYWRWFSVSVSAFFFSANYVWGIQMGLPVWTWYTVSVYCCRAAKRHRSEEWFFTYCSRCTV